MGIEKIAGDPRKVKDEPKKGRSRKQRKINAVQILYETCKEVFANCGPDIVPTPTDIERLKAVLGTNPFFPILGYSFYLFRIWWFN